MSSGYGKKLINIFAAGAVNYANEGEFYYQFDRLFTSMVKKSRHFRIRFYIGFNEFCLPQVRSHMGRYSDKSKIAESSKEPENVYVSQNISPKMPKHHKPFIIRVWTLKHSDSSSKIAKDDWLDFGHRTEITSNFYYIYKILPFEYDLNLNWEHVHSYKFYNRFLKNWISCSVHMYYFLCKN